MLYKYEIKMIDGSKAIITDNETYEKFLDDIGNKHTGFLILNTSKPLVALKISNILYIKDMGINDI